MDLSEHSAGMLSGVGNTVASVASYAGPLVVGAVLERHRSWPRVFAVVVGVNAAAALFYGCCARAEPLDRKGGGPNDGVLHKELSPFATKSRTARPQRRRRGRRRWWRRAARGRR